MIGKASLFALAKALEGIPVLGTLSGTPAARAGIRYGDVLLSVNGMRTKTVLDYIEAKGLREDGMEVVVFRTGSERIETLTYDERAEPVDPTSILSELMSLRIAGGPGDGEAGPGSDPTPS
ncbi:MAG TPA: PDZ domain-containing protein [Polyangiaceae bacterium]|jgi:S1-C subfamily serine protease|nr:PDZ domain-containing protein [Polyangiaceae bacterium]